MTMRNKVVVMMLVHLALTVLAEYCFYKECLCTNMGIICENLQLTQIPQISNNNTDTIYNALDLSSNLITVIPAGSLPSNLSELNFGVNPIRTIADTAFVGSARTLQVLSFSFAQFTKIPDALLPLTALRSFSIENTNILDWNEKAMRNISQTVTSLDLDNVGLTVWPLWIQNFTDLTELTLKSGSISSLPDDALDNLVNCLKSLSLANNSLTMVSKALSKLTVLEELFLNQNKIKEVTWLPQSNRLSTLILTNNQITDAKSLSTILAHYADTMTELDIKFNSLTAIPDFDYFSKLGGFDFSYNKISDPFSGSVSSRIYAVDLSHNSLSQIPPMLLTLTLVSYLVVPYNLIKTIHGNDFPPSVTTVELGYNLISELTNTSFPQSSKITVLHLMNNPITKVSSSAFVNLRHLEELNLQNTKLTRMPFALATLPSVSMLDMTDSQNLVCTCLEKSLQSWVLKLSPQSVLGSCGQLGIYEFFSRLSPDCP